MVIGLERFVNMIKLEDYCCIKLFGEGYHSGATETQMMFIRKKSLEEAGIDRDDIEEYTPYFHELNGKHSEVEGDVIFYDDLSQVDTLKELLIESCEADDWMIYECMLDEFDTDQIRKDHWSFMEAVRVQVVTNVTFNGEVI